MKYNFVYQNTEYHRKLRETLKWYAGFLVKKNIKLNNTKYEIIYPSYNIEGERIDFPLESMLHGGKHPHITQ